MGGLRSARRGGSPTDGCHKFRKSCVSWQDQSARPKAGRPVIAPGAQGRRRKSRVPAGRWPRWGAGRGRSCPALARLPAKGSICRPLSGPMPFGTKAPPGPNCAISSWGRYRTSSQITGVFKLASPPSTTRTPCADRSSARKTLPLSSRSTAVPTSSGPGPPTDRISAGQGGSPTLGQSPRARLVTAGGSAVDLVPGDQPRHRAAPG